MKKRKGFVSNSSSSSFVLCGITVENLTEDKNTLYNICEDNDLRLLSGSDDGVDGTVVGKILASGEDCFDEEVIPLKSLDEIMTKVNVLVLEKKIKLIGNPSIFTGTRCC